MSERRVLRSLAGLALAIAACGWSSGLDSIPPVPTIDPRQAADGRALFVQQCASCHGQNAEGAPGWATPRPEGNTLAPAHDDFGHTWHHPDRVLGEVIREGMGDPLLPESPLRMPAFGDKLSDSEIEALIAYFKTLWSEGHRLWQANETLKDRANSPAP